MKKTIIALLLTIAVVVLAIETLRAVRGQGEYILTVSPKGTVTVTRTDKELHGGPFSLRAAVASGTYTLGTADDSKGIYTVTFYDNTMRPGRYTLAIGESTMDIMEARIFVDQKEEKWKK